MSEKKIKKFDVKLVKQFTTDIAALKEELAPPDIPEVIEVTSALSLPMTTSPMPDSPNSNYNSKSQLISTPLYEKEKATPLQEKEKEIEALDTQSHDSAD